jgi:hypothetical protein
MSKIWMPITAGVLDILSGFFGSGNASQASCVYYLTRKGVGEDFGALFLYYDIVCLLSLIFLALAIVGGVCAFIRRKWSIALAGAIAALFPSMIATVYYLLAFGPQYSPLTLYLMGAGIAAIAAIILTILSRKQFKSKQTKVRRAN